MTKQIETFTHEKFGTLAVVMHEDEAMFIAKEVSVILGYVQTSSMNKLIDKEDKFKRVIQNGTNYTNQSLITESGLYQAIFGSHKTEAKEFKYWVTKTVLPSIRNNGGYIMDQENKTPEEIMAHGLIAAQNIIEEKNAKIEEQGKVIQDKNFPMSLSKMFSGSNKVVQAANLWLEDQGYLSKVFDKGVKIGWKLTSEGEKLGYGSQVSKASVFWIPDVLEFLPSTIELLDFAIKMGLHDHKVKI